MVEIPHEAFAARRSVRAVTRVDHVPHLGEISPPDWQKKPWKRAGKTTGMDYCVLACRRLTFSPLDCAAWLLEREADGLLNVFEGTKGWFPTLTGQEPP